MENDDSNNNNKNSNSSSSSTTSDDITRTEDDMTDLVTDNEQPVIISTFKNFEPTRAATTTTTVNDPLDGIVSNNSFVVQDKSFTKNSNNNNNNSKQQQPNNNNHTKSHASRSKSVFGGLGGLKVFSNMRKTFVSEASTSTNDQLTPQQMKRNRIMTTLNNPTTSSATTSTSTSSSTTHMGNGTSSVTRTNSSPLISSTSSPNASNRTSFDDSIIHSNNNNNNNNTMDHDGKKKSHDNNSNSSHSLHSSTTADQDSSSIVNNNDEFVVLDDNTTMVSDVDIVPLKYTEEEAQTIISDSCLLYKRRSNFFSFIKNDAYLREQRLRRSTIKELYYTEMSYISTLELGYREYYKPMLTDAKQQQKHLTNKSNHNNHNNHNNNNHSNNSTTSTNNSESTDDPNANHTNNNHMSDEHFMFENGEEDLNVIFSNIDQIIHMNKQLALEVLSDARHNSVAMFHPPPSLPVSSDSTPQKSNMNTSNKYYRKSMIEEEICWMYCNVGQIFVKYSPFFKIYATFVNDFDASNQKIEDLNQRSVKFVRFLEVTSDRIQKELSSILITVVQRIPRYELLFRDLLKRTEEDHVDYASIAKALNKINEQASFINEKKRHYENQVFYVRLQQNLLQNHHHYSQLVQPGRVYMKQMQQVIVSCRRRDLNHVSACYLCNDILIVVPSAPVVVASSAAQQQQLMRKRKNALVHHQHSNIQVIFLAFSRVKQMNHSLPVNFAQSSSSVDTATTTTNSSTTASATINNGNGADAEHNSTSDTSSATQYDCETPSSAINSLHQSLSDAIEVKSFQLETWFENSVLTFTFTTESAFQCMELFESLEEQIVDLKRKLSWKLANAKLSADIVDDQSFSELLNDNQSTTSPSTANNNGEVESSSSASPVTPGEITTSVATIESTAEAELSGGGKASSSSTAPPTVPKAASSVDGLELKRVRLYNRFNALQKRIVRIESEQSTLKHHIQVKEFAMKNAKEQVAKVERQIKLEMESLKLFGNQLKEVETQYNQLNNRSDKAKGALAELDKAILYKVLNEDIEAFIQVFNREPECDLTSAMHTTIASSKKNKARMLMQQQQLQQSQEQQQTPVLPQLTLDHQALDLSLKLHKVSNKTQTLIDSSGVNLPQVAGYKATLPPLPSLAASGLSTDRSSSNTSSSPTPSAAAQYSPRQMGNNSGATNTSYYHLNQVEQSMLQQSLGSNGSSSPPLVVPLSSSPKTNNYSYSMRPSHMISKKRVQVRSKSTILGDDPYFRYVQNQIKRAALLSDTASDSGDDLSTDYSIDISSEDIGGSQQWLDNSLNPLYCIPAPQSYRYIQGDTLVYKYLCDRVRLGESTTYTTSDRVDELFDLNIDNRPSNKTSMDHQFETASTTTAPTDLDSSPSPTTMIQPMDVVETGEFDPLLWDESDLPNDPQVLKAMIGKLQTSCLAWKNRCTNNE